MVDCLALASPRRQCAKSLPAHLVGFIQLSGTVDEEIVVFPSFVPRATGQWKIEKDRSGDRQRILAQPTITNAIAGLDGADILAAPLFDVGKDLIAFLAIGDHLIGIRDRRNRLPVEFAQDLSGLGIRIGECLAREVNNRLSSLGGPDHTAAIKPYHPKQLAAGRVFIDPALGNPVHRLPRSGPRIDPSPEFRRRRIP